MIHTGLREDFKMNKYIADQFYKVCPLSLFPENKNGIIRLKIQSEHGATNWINITPEQFKQIEIILTGE
jgi:hypothetical protein